MTDPIAKIEAELREVAVQALGDGPWFVELGFAAAVVAAREAGLRARVAELEGLRESFAIGTRAEKARADALEAERNEWRSIADGVMCRSNNEAAKIAEVDLLRAVEQAARKAWGQAAFGDHNYEFSDALAALDAARAKEKP